MTTKNQYLLELFMEGKSIDEIYYYVLNPVQHTSRDEIEKIIREAIRRRCGWKKK